MEIPNTLDVISQCWKKAEKDVQAEIREDYPGANEEFITQMFHGKLSKNLKAAGKDEKNPLLNSKDLKFSRRFFG